MIIYYYMMKVVLLGSFLRSLVKFEPLHKYAFFLSVLYTALLALLSYVFLLSQFAQPDYRLWLYWLGANLVLVWVYFRLLIRFEEGALFWVILPLAVPLIFNEPNLLPIWKNVLGR